MRRLLKILVSVGLTGALVGSALAVECTPIAPQDFTGTIRFIHQGSSAAIGFFEGNDCSWNGSDGLNGTDGLALDVGGVAGTTGSVTGTLTPTSAFFVGVNAYFLDEGCAQIDGSAFDFTTALPENAESEPVTIPKGAKWLIVTSTTSNVSNDVSVILHSNGKDCPDPVKKKKKKKKS